jgi:hypothetical protein
VIGACGKHGFWVAEIEDKTASGMRRGGKWDRTVQACVAHSSPIEVATVRKFDQAASERVFVAARRARSDVEPARYRRQRSWWS